MSLQVYRLPPRVPADHSQDLPQLRRISVARYADDWTSVLHGCPYTRFFFITGGEGMIETADSSFPVAVNDVVALAANVPHAALSQSVNPLSCVILEADRVPNDSMTFDTCAMLHLTGRPAVQLSVCLEILVQEVQEREPGWEDVCQHLLDIFLRRVARHSELTPFIPTTNGRKAHRDCEQVRRYIDSHFRENLRLDDLAAQVQINKYYLSHTFQREFGVSPISYLISRRIQESRYLLSSTDYTLSQIAHMLGFSSLSYFSQSFRRLEGISPMEYRRQHLNNTSQGGGP